MPIAPFKNVAEIPEECIRSYFFTAFTKYDRNMGPEHDDPHGSSVSSYAMLECNFSPIERVLSHLPI